MTPSNPKKKVSIVRCIYTLKWLVIVVEDLLAHFKMKIDEKKKFEIDFLLEEMENLKFPCAWEEEGEKSKGLATPTLLLALQPIRIKEQS